jgi:hypothetical protein
MTDIANVLAFLKNMPPDLGAMTVMQVVSSQDKGKERVFVKTRASMNSDEPNLLEFSFFFKTSENGDLTITHVFRVPCHPRYLDKAARALGKKQLRDSLGNVFVAPDTIGTIALGVEYKIPLHDLWFTSPEFKIPLVNLLANAMRRLTIDSSQALAAVLKIVPRL